MLILSDALGQNLENQREKKGQYTSSVNLIFVYFLTNIFDFK